VITDLSNYLLSVVSIILLLQWQQTYSVLANPLRAIRTMEHNWAKVTSNVICIIYTVFILFDAGVIITDAADSG